jgi:uncharacterized protein YggU (UPF0235/DUF167 family)
MATGSQFLEVRVKPNSRVSNLQQEADGRWSASVKASPVDGKANEELIALIARHFDCSKAAVSIRRGATSRMKLVRIELA